MSTSDQVEDLLLRWESARRDGELLSPEALCADCPNLTQELTRRIHSIEAMEQLLGVTLAAGQAGATVFTAAASLPRIPGYQIVRVVDEGGMGVVYEAVQVSLGRTVAVKMVSGVRLDATLLARFQAEAQAAAQFHHPNFLQVFEVGQVQGRPFYSMEFVGGGSLAQLIARERPSPRRAAELVEVLARAVHSAHERGIVHRDIKPANVLLTPPTREPTCWGVPKIADFGLVKRLGDESGHTQTGEILGTPSYMAPEQAMGRKEIGPPADVYALGAVLYELLTGQPPFRGTNPLDSLRLVANEPPVAPSRLAAVPRDLEAVCLKCLEKSPAARYASARELADDLRRYLDGIPVSARHAGPFRRAWKWARRHPRWAALAGLLVAMALFGAGVVIGDSHRQRQTRLAAVRQAPLAREILKRNCAHCHDGRPGEIKKNFNVLEHGVLLDPGRRFVVPGAPEESRLLQRIADGSMPPEEQEKLLPRLTERELTILREWIQEGAPAFPDEDPNHPTTPVVEYSEVAARAKAVFRDRCYECHKYDVAKGGIKIMHHRLLVNIRPVVVPGSPEESELYRAITSDDDGLRMPPPPEDPLTPEEIATVREWIRAGAPAFPKTDR